MIEIKDIKEKLALLEPLVNIANDEVRIYYRFLDERISANESYITFLGETSSGKTTLINGLIGSHILPAKASPTTASIVEVNFSGADAMQYYAVNQNATMERLDRSVFMELAEEPDEELKWLRLEVPPSGLALKGMRVFDTPGYDSIVDKHEEVLMDFIPNSDVVIYVVSYKIGIQDQDYRFLFELRELVRDGVPVIPVINRCPVGTAPNDKRIKEISDYIIDIVPMSEKPIIINSVVPVNENEYPLPRADALWSKVTSIIGADERKKMLTTSYDLFIKELCIQCGEIIKARYSIAAMSADELESIRKETADTAGKLRKAVDSILIPGIKKIKENIPEKVNKAKENAYSSIENDINSVSVVKKDETQAFVKYHIVPFRTQEQVSEIQFYLDVEFSDINQKLDDYMNREIADLNSRIDLILNAEVVKAGNNLAKNTAQRFASTALSKFFAGFGGAGGSGAGIANAASHALKKVGDLFGRTFSRETHNAVKHFLAKIGATSMKAVSAAITVFLEGIIVVVDLVTWKSRLISKVSESLDKWETETTDTILKELEEIKKQNIKTINDIADEIEHYYDDEKADIDEIRILEEQMSLYKQIAKQIGVEDERI